MPHLYGPRVGWEGERLAHYLLSRFCFVAQPTTIADDVGSDFYCTIFEITDSTPTMVEPRSSFAIQVKSNTNTIEAHNKIQYFRHLEIPFFIGVVDQAIAELKVYSAERLPMMFAQFGIPGKLQLRLVDNDNQRNYCQRADGVTLDCYYVCTFKASEKRDSLRENVDLINKICRRATSNIGSRRAEEHIYELDAAGNILIVAGCGSAHHFRDNLYKRLAEVFYNFKWILENEPNKFSVAEFRIYEDFYLALRATQSPPTIDLVDRVYPGVTALVHALRCVDAH
jgi:hypothetical protein